MCANTVLGPTRRRGYVSRMSSVTTKPRTESPRCSNLHSDVSPWRGNRVGHENHRGQMVHTSHCPRLGRLEYINHEVLEKTRSLYGSIYMTFIPTWVIFEETGLPSVEAAMGEYLHLDVASDIRQWRQVFLRIGRSASATKHSFSNAASDREPADKPYPGAVLKVVDAALAGSGGTMRRSWRHQRNSGSHTWRRNT